MVAIWRENMLGYLSANTICFRERRSRKFKTVSCEEQIMTKDKYDSIF